MLYACSNGFLEVVQSLISENDNIEICDEVIFFIMYANLMRWLFQNGWKPIHHACANGHVGMVTLLLKHECNIHTCTKVINCI